MTVIGKYWSRCKDYVRFEVRQLQEAENVARERHVAPPADGLFSETLLGWHGVIDCRVVHRNAAANRKFEKGRLEWRDFVSAAAGTFGE